MSSSLAETRATLVRQFRRQRPLRGGSLIITLFGDAIAPRGGSITLGSLIALMAPFGLTERLVRTSVARLAQDGWLASRREGRRSEYRLTTSGRARFAEATRRIYGESPHEWDGHWTVLLLQADGADRERVRQEMLWAGFGALSGGVLAHPVITPVEARHKLSSLGAAGSAIVMRASLESEAADRRCATQGWDLAGLEKRYRRFLASFTPVREALAATSRPDVEDAFVLRTLLIHEYRKIHLRDPLLPVALLPQDWAGSRAAQLCRKLYGELFPPSEEHLAACAETISGRLPALTREAYARFGGLTLPARPAR